MMTPQEHELVARMFAKQLHYTKLLIEILHSKEVLEGDDLAAFLSVSRADPARNSEVIEVAKKEYRKAAKEIGLRVSFPKT
jgi:hypothetical protein